MVEGVGLAPVSALAHIPARSGGSGRKAHGPLVLCYNSVALEGFSTSCRFILYEGGDVNVRK